MNIIDSIEKEGMRTDIPEFNIGDTVKVHVRITEGEKSRIQIYEGLVISVKGGGVSKTFTVRKISGNQVGVERTFMYNSPVIAKLEVVRRGKVRRNKINYIRNLSGKAARIKEAK